MVLKLTIDGEVLAHEMMRVVLQEIAQRHNEEPWVSSEDADLAKACLKKVDELEGNRGT